MHPAPEQVTHRHVLSARHRRFFYAVTACGLSCWLVITLLLLGRLSRVTAHGIPGSGAADNTGLVSLSPSVTRMLIDLEQGHRLAGRTAYCPQLPHNPPVVGSLLLVHTEQIARLAPQLIICSEEDGSTLRLQPLRMSGLNILELAQNRDFEDILRQYSTLAAATGTAGIAGQKISAYRRNLAHIETPDQRPAVMLLLSVNPPIAATSSSFIGDMIERAGGYCIVQAEVPWQRLTSEAVVSLRLQYCLFRTTNRLMQSSPACSGNAALYQSAQTMSAIILPPILWLQLS
jgi:ABC-type hemin transport system substrate-binding protein